MATTTRESLIESVSNKDEVQLLELFRQHVSFDIIKSIHNNGT